MANPGCFYVVSGKLDPSKISIFTILGLCVSSGVGYLYSAITIVNPLIYINFILLGGVVYLLVKLTALVCTLGHSRNKYANVFIGLLMSLMAWYSNWVTIYSNAELSYFPSFFNFKAIFEFMYEYSLSNQVSIGYRTLDHRLQLGSLLLIILYFIEFIIFFTSGLLPVQIPYFNEKCKKNYKSKTIVIRDIHKFNLMFGKASKGHFGFIGTLYWTTNPKFEKKEAGRSVIVIKFHYLQEYPDDSIIDVYNARLEYNERFEYVDYKIEGEVIKGMYVDIETNEVFASNIRAERTEENENYSYPTVFECFEPVVDTPKKEKEIEEIVEMEIDEETRTLILNMQKTEAIAYCVEKLKLSLKDAKLMVKKVFSQVQS